MHSHPVHNSQALIRVLHDDGSADPSADPQLSIDEIVGLYEAMVRTRLIDERMVSLQRQGRIGFHIGSLGEEATVVGSAYALRPGDFVFPAYREIGAGLLRGFPLEAYVHNMFGTSQDPAKGRQMPDHYCWAPAQLASVSSPIGTQITHAVGYAWAAKLEGRDLVTLTYFGEGATSSSEFHNGLNFAGVFRTPTIFLCRNNGFAISVPAGRQTASVSFAHKGEAYGVPHVQCDGNDLLAVVRVTREAVQRAASGHGPTLIEAMTYRLAGHSTSDDPTIYRDADELKRWQQRDPIERVRRHLEGRGHWDEPRQARLVRRVEQELQRAIDQAERTEAPSLTSMFQDVYSSMPWHLREQCEQLERGPRFVRTH